jgi:hypothetical protein
MRDATGASIEDRLTAGLIRQFTADALRRRSEDARPRWSGCSPMSASAVAMASRSASGFAPPRERVVPRREGAARSDVSDLVGPGLAVTPEQALTA